MPHKRIAVLITCCCVAVIGFASTTTSAKTSSKSPITLVSVLDETGPHKAFSISDLRSIQSAAAFLNSRGGVLGRQVRVKNINNNGDPAATVSGWLRYRSQNPGPGVVIGAEDTVTIAALIPVLAKDRSIIQLMPTDGNAQCKAAKACPRGYSFYPPVEVSAVSAVAWIKKQRYKHVGMLVQDFPYGVTEGAAIKPLFRKAGIKSTSITYPSTTVDLKSQMEQLKASGVDVVRSMGIPPFPGVVLKARQALDWNVPVLFDSSGSAGDITKMVPSAEYLRGTYEEINNVQNADAKLPGRDFQRKFSKPYGPISSLAGAGALWDAVMTWAAAAKKAGSLDINAINRVMLHLPPVKNTIVTKQPRFTAGNHENQGGVASDFAVVKVGPKTADGLVHPLR